MSHITATRRTRLWCVLLATVVMALSGCASPEESDSALAFCLATAQQAKFVDGAVALAAVTRGRTPGTIAGPTGGDLTIADWKKGNEQAFDRVCDAIRPADPPNDLTNAAVALVNIIVGALLAGGTAAITANITRRRHTSDTLRDSAHRLMSAMRSYVRRPDLPDADVRDRMSMVETALQRARSARRRSRERVDTALQDLERLRTLTDDGWPINPGQATEAHANSLTDVARTIQQRAETIATGLDRGWWRSLPEQP